MTNGPFMQVSLTAGSRNSGDPQSPRAAIPGDEIVADGGAASLHVRVQCANWIDINRVGIYGHSGGGFMTAAALLVEKSKPNDEEIDAAMSGVLCRCTGYYKIVSAIENATQLKQERIESGAQ